MTVFGNGDTTDDHPDLPARIDTATAMRRLAHAIVSHRADIATLHRIAQTVDRFAAELEAQPDRGRLDELLANPRFAAALDGGTLRAGRLRR